MGRELFSHIGKVEKAKTFSYSVAHSPSIYQAPITCWKLWQKPDTQKTCLREEEWKKQNISRKNYSMPGKKRTRSYKRQCHEETEKELT